MEWLDIVSHKPPMGLLYILIFFLIIEVYLFFSMAYLVVKNNNDKGLIALIISVSISIAVIAVTGWLILKELL